ncbi:unnamed protein product [Spirodela intermedia]|uniref:Uncharacterized protein n=1 Tax=Spirodela intermedia TaxID=51605 RepID=A0A7I8KM96_SPIIN|nr:unnamed protein product [Spirodela intermedia]
MAEGGIQGLLEGCISHIISFTSPADACRLAAVSQIFRSAAVSDSVWDRFLPPDISEIVSRAVHPVEYFSKKDLFFRLCRSILVDGGAKSFALERSSGKKCFLLSARELTIIWGDTPHYWDWISVPGSRFSEVARLLDVCWLEIRGKIECGMLSQKTSYAAHLIFKITEETYGLGFPQQASVKLGDSTSEKTVCLHPDQPQQRPWWRGPLQWPLAPIEIGRFFCDDGDDGEAMFAVTETRGGHWKRGLLVEGIEVRPAS